MGISKLTVEKVWAIRASREPRGKLAAQFGVSPETIYDIVRGKFSLDDLSGPVGITKQIAKAASRGAVDFLGIVIMISVYLGLFNLLPLPALDGGRAVFLLVESVRRRQVSPRVEAAIHSVGFVLLLGVLLIVSFKDVRSIFGKG